MYREAMLWVTAEEYGFYLMEKLLVVTEMADPWGNAGQIKLPGVINL